MALAGGLDSLGRGAERNWISCESSLGWGLGGLRWGVWEAFSVRIGAGRYDWCIGQPTGRGEVTGAVVTAVLFLE